MTTPSDTNDEIFENLLRRELNTAQEINGDSEVVTLIPESVELPSRYIARFHLKTFIRNPGEQPALYDGPIDIGIHFPKDYLRKPPQAQRVFTVLQPINLYHPNLHGPGVCATIHPGSSLSDLLFTLWSMLTFRKRRFEHPLNPEAATWARRNQHRFPTDDRPLRGTSSAARIEFSEVES